MFKKYKKIIYAIAIIVVLFFVYSFFTGGESDDALLTSSVNGTSRGYDSGADVIGSEIIQALNQIEALKLDKKIFQDIVYRSLVDRSEPITPEPVGRDNPFAPIGSGASDQTIIEIPQESGTSSDLN